MEEIVMTRDEAKDRVVEALCNALPESMGPSGSCRWPDCHQSSSPMCSRLPMMAAAAIRTIDATPDSEGGPAFAFTIAECGAIHAALRQSWRDLKKIEHLDPSIAAQIAQLQEIDAKLCNQAGVANIPALPAPPSQEQKP